MEVILWHGIKLGGSFMGNRLIPMKSLWSTGVPATWLIRLDHPENLLTHFIGYLSLWTHFIGYLRFARNNCKNVRVRGYQWWSNISCNIICCRPTSVIHSLILQIGLFSGGSLMVILESFSLRMFSFKLCYAPFLSFSSILPMFVFTIF